MAFHQPTLSAVRFGGAPLEIYPPPPSAAPSSETWLFDGQTWTLASPATTPLARSGHSMMSVGTRVYMFGGVDHNGSPINDLWEWNGNDWSRFVSSTAPAPRAGAAMAGGVVFGGYDPISGTHFDDVWQVDTGRWYQFPASGPSARRNAAMAEIDVWNVARDQLILHGGRDAQGNILSDTWSFSPRFGTWTLLPPGGPARAEHAMFFDDDSDQLYMTGGVGPAGLANDLWRFDGLQWFDMSTAVGPLPVRAAAATLDPVRHRILVVGGATSTGSGPATDAHWEWGSTNPQFESFGSGCAAWGPVPTLTAGPRAARGSSIYFEVANLRLVDLPYLLVGFSDSQWNGTPLPLSLSAYRLPGCELGVAIDDSYLMDGIPTLGTGRRYITVPVPDTQALLGLEFFTQGAVLSSLQQRLRGVTNALRATIY